MIEVFQAPAWFQHASAPGGARLVVCQGCGADMRLNLDATAGLLLHARRCWVYQQISSMAESVELSVDGRSFAVRHLGRPEAN